MERYNWFDTEIEDQIQADRDYEFWLDDQRDQWAEREEADGDYDDESE